MRKITILAAVAALSLAACANSPIDQFAHKDIQHAETIAVTPERATVWKAVDAAITAQETIDAAIAAQAKACAAAIESSVPETNYGLATLIESSAGGVTKIDANCKPITVPTFVKIK